MLFRFAAVACAFGCAAVNADSQIINTANDIKTGDIIDTAVKAVKDEGFTNLERKEKTTIASCLFNNPEKEKNFQYDGEFDGLKPGMRRMSTHALEDGHIQCGYDYIFNEVDIKQHFLEELLSVEMPKMINDLSPGSKKLDQDTLANFLEFFDTTLIDPREKGPDYLVIDNFAEYFNIEETELQGAKSEAEQLT